MNLCSNCERIDIRQLPPTTHPEVQGFQLATLRQICEAVGECHLCQLLKNHLLTGQGFKKYVTAEGPVEEYADLVLVLRRPPKDGFTTEHGARLSGFDASLGPREFTFKVHLYAPRGTRDGA